MSSPKTCAHTASVTVLLASQSSFNSNTAVLIAAAAEAGEEQRARSRGCSRRTVHRAAVSGQQPRHRSLLAHQRAYIGVEGVEQGDGAAVPVLRELLQQQQALHVAPRTLLLQQKRGERAQTAEQLRQVAAAGAHELASDCHAHGHVRGPPAHAVLLHAVLQIPAQREAEHMRARAPRLAHDDISGSLFGTAWEYIMSLSRFLALTAESAKSLGQQSLTSALYLRHDSHTMTADGSAGARVASGWSTGTRCAAVFSFFAELFCLALRRRRRQCLALCVSGTVSAPPCVV
jgi:hypothetical protein